MSALKNVLLVLAIAKVADGARAAVTQLWKPVYPKPVKEKAEPK